MSILDSVTKPKLWPPLILLLGPPKVGKTTLAGNFPAPIFVRTEDGTASVPNANVLPICATYKEITDQLTALVEEEHEYKTVIIDSITQLDRALTKEIEDAHGGQTLNKIGGGWGVGSGMLQARHAGVLHLIQRLKRRGLIVVMIGHSKISTITPPDGEPYDKYTLSVSTRIGGMYEDPSDLIGYIKSDAYKSKSDKRIIDTGKRVVVVKNDSANISGNRYGITKDIELTKEGNPLLAEIVSRVKTIQAGE